MKKLVVVLSILCFIFATAAVELYLTKTPIQNIEMKEDNKNSSPFLSPLVAEDNPNDILINFKPLRDALRYYVNNTGTNLGVYFEYLPSGISINVNGNNEYYLASLVKVPAVMAVLKQEELGKIDPNTIVTLQKEDLDNGFGDLYKKAAGYKLSLIDTEKLAIQQSDNTAYRAIFRLVSPQNINDVFDSLDIPLDTQDNLPIVSPKNYSSILKSLYLSSYLSSDNSAKVLRMMSQSKFKEGIVSGVPNNITVSNKTGQYIDKNDQKSITSDCGIVYVPQRSYSICIMYKGDPKDASKHFSNVSKLIYQFVSQVKANQ